MIARVLGVIAASIWFSSMLKVTGSMSTNTGRAPNRAIDPAVAPKVKGVVITSSFGPISRAIRARSRASEPEAHPIANFAPTYSAISASSACTSGPRMKCCESRTRVTASRTSSRIPANCAFRSRNWKSERIAPCPFGTSVCVRQLVATENSV